MDRSLGSAQGIRSIYIVFAYHIFRTVYPQPACQNDTARIDPGDILAHTGCRFYGVAAAQVPRRRAGSGRGKGQPPAALGPPPRRALGPPARSLLDRCDGGTVYYGGDPVDGELSPDEREQEDFDAPAEHQASPWAVQFPCQSVMRVKSHVESLWPYCK